MQIVECLPDRNSEYQQATYELQPSCGTRMKPRCASDRDCPPIDVAVPTIRDRCRLERELYGREVQLMLHHEQMLLEQQLHNREQLLWDQEQFRRQQLLKREQQFRYKAQQQLMEQDLHNRDLQTRSDHESMLWEREMYQQDQILANARQQMLLQRDMMFQQEDNVSKQRMHIYNVCFTKPITCGPDINLPLPVLQNKTAGQSQAEDKNQVDNKSLSETTESVQVAALPRGRAGQCGNKKSRSLERIVNRENRTTRRSHKSKMNRAKITPYPNKCACECHDNLYHTNKDFCNFCDCAKLYVRKPDFKHFSDLILSPKKVKKHNEVSPNSSQCIYCGHYYDSNQNCKNHIKKCCSQCVNKLMDICKRHDLEISASNMKQSRSKYSNCKIKAFHDYICCEHCFNHISNSKTKSSQDSYESESNVCNVPINVFDNSCSSSFTESNDKNELQIEEMQQNPKKNEDVTRFRILDKVRHNTQKSRGPVFNGEEVIDMIFHNDDFTDCS